MFFAKELKYIFLRFYIKMTTDYDENDNDITIIKKLGNKKKAIHKRLK